MIAILQPLIPHYREDFFEGLQKEVSCDIYCYEKREKSKSDNFKHAHTSVKGIAAIEPKKFLLYNPFTLLKRRYSTLVLMLNKGHISTWFLLFTSFLHRKKIILWGHGISVRRYAREEKKLPFTLRWMIKMADGVWFYTDKEQQLWKRHIPSLRSVALNNTISEVDKIVRQPEPDKKGIRSKHGMMQQVFFIFCARFNDPARRTDLLLQAIQKMDATRFGFIIIGDGKLKPDFKPYNNVYDFGEVYDRTMKDELFAAADIYFQPAWIGLSVVEAMAYGLPVFALKRSEIISQGVEYGYIENNVNGMLFSDIRSFTDKAGALTHEQIQVLGRNAKTFAETKLSMDNMVNSALTLLQSGL